MIAIARMDNQIVMAMINGQNDDDDDDPQPEGGFWRWDSISESF